MKLVALLSIATLVACDYSASQPEAPSDAYAPPDKVEGIDETIAPIEPGKSFFKFNNVYRGAFPPARFPPANFLTPSSFPSFNYPFKSFNFPASRQTIFPPISQIVPPQISQIVPPISQIVPPAFGNVKPSLPVPAPAPIIPPQFFPPSASPLLTKFTFPHYSPLYQYPYAFPPTFPSTFPSTFAFPPSPFFPPQTQKQPSKTQPESLSASYGPPVSDPEPAGAAETSAPFEPSPVSYPYEPAAPEDPEPAANPHKPAQEYGLPPLK